MAGVQTIADLVARQVAEEVTEQAACPGGSEYDGRLPIRISAIFVILVTSLFGAVFPVYAGRHRGVGVPEWAFFTAKYFGSGVIIATAFIHLLAPANDALRDPCLTGAITSYVWVEGIALMTIFVLFFIELMAMRYATFGHDHTSEPSHDLAPTKSLSDGHEQDNSQRHTPGEDHLSHTREHIDNSDTEHNLKSINDDHAHVEDYAAQMTAILILEFGVIFHSIFIGLTLAVTPSAEFTTLYIVLVFHQTFEGLGLGSRLSATPWPKSKRWTPYLLGAAYSLSTPIAIAVGLALRKSYSPGSQTALIVNGVFDSISAGILIYTGLVELMAHEFMFSSVMRKASLRVVMSAFGMMCLGAGLMALLGKWA